jgi:hypothetical protein
LLLDSYGNFAILFPQVLRLYCDEAECKTVQIWERRSEPHFGEAKGPQVNIFTSVIFHCRNCRRSAVRYFFHVDAQTKGGQITKVGQWPPLSRAADPVVVAGWSEADKLLYRDAMTFGIRIRVSVHYRTCAESLRTTFAAYSI